MTDIVTGHQGVKEKKGIWSKTIIALIFFLYFYNPPMHYFGIPLSASKLIILLSLFIGLSDYNKYYSDLFSRKYTNIYLYIIFVCIIIYFVANVIHIPNGDNFYIVRMILYIIEIIIPLKIIINRFAQYSLDDFFDIVIVITFIQSLIMSIAIFYIPLKLFVFELQSADPASANFSQFGYSKFDFRGLAIASDVRLGLAIFHSVACILIIRKINNTKILLHAIFLSFVLFIVAVGGILGARTFFISFGILLITYIIIGLSVHKKFKWKGGVLILTILFLLGFTTMTIIEANVKTKQDKLIVEMFQDWAFEVFRNYGATGRIETASSNALAEEHYNFLPPDMRTWIIGDDNRFIVNGRHYSARFTDSGYVLIIFYGGIVLSAFIYSFWIYLSLKTSSLFYKYKKDLFFLPIGIMIALFVGQFKTDFIPGSLLILKLPFFLYIYISERKK